MSQTAASIYSRHRINSWAMSSQPESTPSSHPPTAEIESASLPVASSRGTLGMQPESEVVCPPVASPAPNRLSDPDHVDPTLISTATGERPKDAAPQMLVEGNYAPQVRFKNERGKLLLILPGEHHDTAGGETLAYAWPEVTQQLKQRLQAEARSWMPNTAVHLIARDRLLNAQQLQDIADILEMAKLQLRRVYTSRRQTAITAATAGYSVEQHVAVSNLKPTPIEAGQAMAEPLVLCMTLRSGVEVRHNGTVVIMGDLNPGSSVIAEGDILVWGRLRGLAHAGSKGNVAARIMALQMEPAQLRIADFVARGPATPPQQICPEIAYVNSQGLISIAQAGDLSKLEGLPLGAVPGNSGNA